MSAGIRCPPRATGSGTQPAGPRPPPPRPPSPLPAPLPSLVAGWPTSYVPELPRVGGAGAESCPPRLPDSNENSDSNLAQSASIGRSWRRPTNGKGRGRGEGGEGAGRAGSAGGRAPCAAAADAGSGSSPGSAPNGRERPPPAASSLRTKCRCSMNSCAQYVTHCWKVYTFFTFLYLPKDNQLL